MSFINNIRNPFQPKDKNFTPSDASRSQMKMAHNDSINGYKQSFFGGKNALEMTSYGEKQDFIHSVADEVRKGYATTSQRRDMAKFNHTSLSSSKFL